MVIGNKESILENTKGKAGGRSNQTLSNAMVGNKKMLQTISDKAE